MFPLDVSQHLANVYVLSQQLLFPFHAHETLLSIIPFKHFGWLPLSGKFLLHVKVQLVPCVKFAVHVPSPPFLGASG